ncbi:MAG: SMP-30/gluconolactonase/LRE family protein, partial [Candidatus Competibacteraceae bacterium]|nr:SMP-30/gluconolactonase/LRE family protein [Candidatus Competibacteraceae bacterium]
MGSPNQQEKAVLGGLMNSEQVHIDLHDLEFIGQGLNRPECVLCTANGRIFTADWRGNGGVGVLEADGSQWLLEANNSEFQVRPNGICLLSDGTLLLTHLGADDGGVFRLDEQGTLSPYLMEVEGVPLPPTNYAHLDFNNRLWITVSTRLMPRAKGYRPDNADGFIVLLDSAGARVVADGLGYTNECLVHPDGKHLYVNETFTRKLSRFDIADDGSLLNKTTITEFGAGTFPDGLTFDTEGGIWITSIVSNRVIRLDADGRQTLVLEDNDPEHLAWV